MSAIGTKRTSLVALHMSAIGGKADIGREILDSVAIRASAARVQQSVTLFANF